MDDRAPAIAIAKRAAVLVKARRAEKGDRYDFLTRADHVCSLDPPCSREYDPRPPGEVPPEQELYEGTGIGALYGYPRTRPFLPDLAGWNLA